MFIDTLAVRNQAGKRAYEILASPTQESIRTFVDNLGASSEWEWAKIELGSIVLIDGGELLGDMALVAEGVKQLDEWPGEPPATARYNRANGLLTLWERSLRKDGPAETFLHARSGLHEARRTFEQIGADTTELPELRVQCLVNAANSYDTIGRDQEAFRLWGKALEIDPEFSMARGNRAYALVNAGHQDQTHGPMLWNEAAIELDRALSNPSEIVRVGGPRALRRFRDLRQKLPEEPYDLPTSDSPWADPYLEWCRSEELFLHTSHHCLKEGPGQLDDLMIRKVTGDRADPIGRVDDLFDAFNALKQDYISVRYLRWLSTDPSSPIFEEASQLRDRARFIDGLNYGRWGVRTGLLVQAFASGANLLDKIAGTTHAYFRTGATAKQIYFRHFWSYRDNRVQFIYPELRRALEPNWNAGLTALCDLSNDLDDETTLSRLVEMRNAATHRPFVVHELPPPESTEWLSRIEVSELRSASLDQLRVCRAALIYLVRAINASEKRIDESDHEGVYIPMPVRDVDRGFGEMD